MAVFHEGLTLVQRDETPHGLQKRKARASCSARRSAARAVIFSSPIIWCCLICRSIRKLLEQRIGRLDRIGQRSEVHIHVPFVINSFQEVLARWYHEGLNSFEEQLQGGRELLERFGPVINNLKSREELEHLILETRAARHEIAMRLYEGRDRLMEMNSFRPKVAEKTVEEIRREDADTTLEQFMLSMFDYYACRWNRLRNGPTSWAARAFWQMSFPGLPSGGFTITFDRARALVREDMQFMTWDHPLVTGAFDLLLGSEKGNCSADPSCGRRTRSGVPARVCRPTSVACRPIPAADSDSREGGWRGNRVAAWKKRRDTARGAGARDRGSGTIRK